MLYFKVRSIQDYFIIYKDGINIDVRSKVVLSPQQLLRFVIKNKVANTNVRLRDFE